MPEIEDARTATMNAIRQVESQGNYGFQRSVRVGPNTDRKVGAYGIMESKWAQIADTLGYSGADWRDPHIQDSIISDLIQRHYKELGSWELAAVALRFGGQVARALNDKGFTEPSAMEQAGLEDIGQYVRDIRSRTPRMDSPVAGNLSTEPNQLTRSPQTQQAKNIMRTQVIAMRDAQRKGVSANGSNEDIDTSGNQGIPDNPEQQRSETAPSN